MAPLTPYVRAHSNRLSKKVAKETRKMVVMFYPGLTALTCAIY
jgi:hypothetical protein